MATVTLMATENAMGNGGCSNNNYSFGSDNGYGYGSNNNDGDSVSGDDEGNSISL
jgi:hypothetical protein